MEPAVTTPVETPIKATVEATSVDRRRFLRWLMSFSVVSTLAMVATPVLGFLVPPKTASTAAGGKVLAGTVTDIPVGKGKVVALAGKPVIVINTDQGVRAYSAICTHLGCIVAWNESARAIVCPCHDGRFNASTGAVISGPPPAPLAPVNATVEEDKIFLVSA
jgi:cytochrome b6-f complex iron-sulfur subunit